MATVIGAMPHYGSVHPRAAAAFWGDATERHRLRLADEGSPQHAFADRHEFMKGHAGGSLLAHVFNMCWASALSMRDKVGASYFVMLHSDVAPVPGWLDTLVAILEERQADVVSLVLPIKDDKGTTSTAIDDPNDIWAVHRRLTMHEVHTRLPETFDAADCGYPDRALLVNTGCWICNFKAPWVERFPGFVILDRITRTPDGTILVQNAPEDWNFSRFLHSVGAKVYATRAVKADHWGQQAFPNHMPWGRWQQDEAFKDKHQGEPVGKQQPQLVLPDGTPCLAAV